MLTITFEKVATAHGFDYYAVWDGTQWLENLWVRVVQGSSSQQVEDAFYRNDTVTAF